MSLKEEFNRDTTLILCLVIIAAILRLDFLWASNFRIDADEAIVGLMAKHIFEGGSIPAFYYGQHYMGSLEAIFVAQLFRIFGISAIALKLVPLGFSLLLIPLMYVLGFRLGGKVSARIAALFMTVPPASLVLWSSMARGGFAEVIFIGALATIFSLRWITSERTSLFLTFLIWSLFGFGWWVNNQILYFILPISLLALIKLIRETNGSRSLEIGKAFLVSILGFLIGGAPYWIYNLNNDFVSLNMFKSASGSNVTEHFIGLISTAIPMILGSIRFWSDESIFPGAVTVGYILYLLPLIYVVLRLRSAIGNLVLFKLTRDRGLLLTLGIFVSILFIFAFSEFGYLVKAPRYLLPIYVPLFLLCSVFIGRMYRISPIIATSWLILMILFNITSSYLYGRAIGGEPHIYSGERVSKDHGELITWLTKNNYKKVKTNYWIGYRLAFETNEGVTFIVYQDPRQVRIPEYEIYDDSIDLPYVLVPTQAVRAENALTALGLRYKKINLSNYVVIYGITEPKTKLQKLPPSHFTVKASHHDEVSKSAVDGDIKTRWGSASPQSSGMSFSINFNEPTLLAGFQYDFGEWGHDFPRGLRVEALGPDGQTDGQTGEQTGEQTGKQSKVIFDEKAFDDIFYFLDHPTSIKVYFEPQQVRTFELTLTGHDSVFDWSIAEITFLTNADKSN